MSTPNINPNGATGGGGGQPSTFGAGGGAGGGGMASVPVGATGFPGAALQAYAAPQPQATPASNEIHDRVTALEDRLLERFKQEEESVWTKVDNFLHSVLFHAKSIGHALAGTSIAALAWKLFQHIS